jgi:hypothetical protein
MKPWSRHFFLLFLLLIAACSAIYEVSYDYDQEVDLTGLRSYDWFPIPKGVEADDLVAGRVKKAVNAEMAEKGIRADSADPDFLIAMHVGSEEKVSQSDGGTTYSFYWHARKGRSRSFRYQEGTLVLDFIDGKSRQFVWRGQAKGFVDNNSNPEKGDKQVNEAVRKILKNFPPR